MVRECNERPLESIPLPGNPQGTPDSSAYLGSLGLAQSVDPSEVLARSSGRRATDTVEVVAELTVDQDTGHAFCSFFVRSGKHVQGADDAIDSLHVGDYLGAEPDTGNHHDPHSRILLTIDGAHVGFIPAHLTEFLSRSEELNGESAVVVVEHLGARDGPTHFRLLCHLVAPWLDGQSPFSGTAFESLVGDDPEAGF